MKFSERYGYTESIIDKKSISSQLQNRIWNRISAHLENHYKPEYLNKILFLIYDKCFGLAVNNIKYDTHRQIFNKMTQIFLQFDWYQVYNFIEDILSIRHLLDRKGLEKYTNNVLEEENSAYRIIDYRVIEITTKEEIEAIEEALSSGFEGVEIHLKQAVTLISNRDKPDYRNVIKESISAVESICQLIAGDKNATLGKALDVIEKKYKIHKALKDGFDKIYGYTSNSDGIRHSLIEKPEHLTLLDAKFMLIACSAFVNYLIGKISELEIEIKS